MPRFPAKLLVLGEHTVLHGSSAYAVPLSQFSAELLLHDKPVDQQHPLLDFASWSAFAKTHTVLRRHLDLEQWQHEAGRLAVDSTIPLGYGLGSSGALTAAVYTRYRKTQDTPDEDRIHAIFRTLEGYFHGTSSGLDPLVSYTGRGILVDGKGQTSPSRARALLPYFGQPDGQWFLLDSGRPRAGKQAITQFGEAMQKPQWQQRAFVPMVKLVASLLACHERGLTCSLSDLTALSNLQQHHLSFLIPEHVSESWRVLAKAELAYLKLCGAGGGGYFLGYAPNADRLTQSAPELAPQIVWL